jgi:UDP-3-O-[3-hydroxymyristoyl] glucosamine N-acyltransferase
VLGSPAIPVREQRRIFQLIARLPEMHKQFRELMTQLAALGISVPSQAADASHADRPEQEPGT